MTNMADLKAFAEQLVNLTVKEVNELAAILKDEYGIEPAAAAVAVAGPAAGGAAPAAEEKTSFNVILKSGGANKLNVVKIVKDLTGLGLKEAKDLVDGAPKPVKEGVSKADADALKRQIDTLDGAIKRTRDTLHNDLNTRASADRDRIWQQINDAVIDYARTHGYDLIVPSPVVYANPRIDITDAVLDQLRRAKPATGTPP